jgi:hypothetical protein
VIFDVFIVLGLGICEIDQSIIACDEIEIIRLARVRDREQRVQAR